MPLRSDTPTPILKRKPSTSRRLPLRHPCKRLRFAPSVTLSPSSLNTTNPNPFIPPPHAHTSQPHSQHTCALHQRPRIHFTRRAPGYTPGCWASVAFEEKASTSWFGARFEDMDAEVQKEMEEEEEVRGVVGGLKVVVGVWVGMWWVRRVEGLRREMYG